MCVDVFGFVFPDLPPLAVDVSDAVGQRVGSQQRGGALRPVHRHKRVLAHQHLAHVLCARHPDQRAAQKVGLEDVAVLLPPRCVEARTLERERQREDMEINLRALQILKDMDCVFQQEALKKPQCGHSA